MIFLVQGVKCKGKLQSYSLEIQGSTSKTAPCDDAVERSREVSGLHSLQQFTGGHLHAVEGEPLFAKVFDAGTEVIDRLINTEEAVM